MTIEKLVKGIDKSTQNWNTNYEYAKKFYEENGHLKVYREYIVDGRQIGRWVETQINRKKGVSGKSLTEIEIEKLEAIGIVWDCWDTMYQLAKKYYKIFGNLIVPRNYVMEGENLGFWVNYQRASYKKGTLSPDKIKLLDDIGMVWDLRKYNFLTREINRMTKRNIKIALLKELKNVLEENILIENVEETFVKSLEL